MIYSSMASQTSNQEIKIEQSFSYLNSIYDLLNHVHIFSQQVKAEDRGKIGAETSSRCECREIVGKIMEQVKVESEQWTEMQAMLEQVRQEMLELQSSRDLWQRRAIASDTNVRSLHAQVCNELFVFLEKLLVTHRFFFSVFLFCLLEFDFFPLPQKRKKNVLGELNFLLRPVAKYVTVYV